MSIFKFLIEVKKNTKSKVPDQRKSANLSINIEIADTTGGTGCLQIVKVLSRCGELLQRGSPAKRSLFLRPDVGDRWLRFKDPILIEDLYWIPCVLIGPLFNFCQVLPSMIHGPSSKYN